MPHGRAMAEMVCLTAHFLGGKSGQQSVGCPDVKQFMTGDWSKEQFFDQDSQSSSDDAHVARYERETPLTCE